MMRSNIVVVLTLLLALISPAYSGIAWGTFLGADWADAEGERNSDQIVLIKHHRRSDNTLNSLLPRASCI